MVAELMQPKIHLVEWTFDGKVLRATIELGESATIKRVDVMKDATPARGLGDTLEHVIKKISGGKIKPCDGCKKRRELLNKVVPYKGKKDGS